jgi:HK97 family phage major capsid protein
MNKLQELIEERGRKIHEMRSIADSPKGSGGDLDTDQAKRFDTLKKEVEAIESRMERARSLEEMERRMTGETLTGYGDQHLDGALKDFSLRKAIAGAAGLDIDWSRERELGQEIARRSGRNFNGIAVPLSVLEQRVMTTTNPAGGPGSNMISTDHLGGQFIDLLRANSVVYGMGARLLTGLVGNAAIPRLKVGTTFGWVAENAALSAADAQIDQVSLTPKHGGCLTEFSRNMLLQSSPDIESMLRMDMGQNIAAGIDQAAIIGGAANGPVGILGTSGIGDVALGANGAAPTWAAVLQLIETAQLANAPTAKAGFITTAKAVRKMRSTVRVANTDSRMIQEEATSLAGYPLAQSTNVPHNLVKGTSGATCSALIFGDLSELLIGLWSELDILVNPYESTAYSKGNIQVRAMCTLDVKLRHAASFAAIKDMLTV